MNPIKVFLASSAEGLGNERIHFSTLIKSISKDKKINIEPYTWEENRGFYSDPHHTIQESIDPELASCSIVFFLFYNKLGDGVKHEFEKVCKNKKIQLYFYQKECNFSLSADSSIEKIQQMLEMQSFLNGLKRDRYIINSFSDDKNKGLNSFQSLIKRDIEKFIKDNHLVPEEDTTPLYKTRINIESAVPMNNHFVGRLDELNDLSQRINDNEVVAVYGMGGMGKTSLIAQYCKTNESEYEKIVWVPYHNNVKDSILSLGADYSYQHGGQQVGFGDIVSSLNSIEGNKLIVFDNFDIDGNEINEKYNEIKQCFPTFKILFTTRTDLSILDDEIDIFNLNELRKEEAIELFKEYYHNDLDGSQVSFSELSLFLETVYNHTLIIELVAKTLRNHFSMTISEILGYVRHENELEQLPPEKTGWVGSKPEWKACGVAITDISTKLYNMDLLSSEEHHLLELLAIICEEGIDARFLMRVIAPDNRRRFEDLVNRLSTNGWVNKTGFYIKCHRILADIVLRDPKFDIDAINTVLRNLATMTSYNALDDVAAKKPYYQMQRLLLTYLSKNCTLEGVSSSLIADNAINFCYNGATLDAEKGRNQSQVSSNIEDKQSYRFLIYAKRQCKDNQIEICHINECLAHIYIDYYRYDDALVVLNEAKRIEDEQQESDTLDKAKTLYELANLQYNYNDRGEMASALEYLNQSYRIYSNLLKEDCIENLNNCLLYIRILSGLDVDEDVKKWVEKAQSIIDKSNVDNNNPLLIQYYIDLSSADREKKLHYLEKAEEIALHLYGNNHPLLGQIAIEKSMYYLWNHNYDEANNCINQWIQNDIVNFGHTAETDFYGDYYKLLVLYCSDKEDKWTSLIDQYEKSACSVIDSDKISTFQSSSVRWCCQMIGVALYQTGQYEKALVYLEKAYNTLSKELINYNYGRTQELLNAVSSTINKSNKLRSKLLGSDDIVTIVDCMVRCLMSLDRIDDAITLLNKTEETGLLRDSFSTKQYTQIRGEVALLSKQNELASQYFYDSLKETQGDELNELVLSISDKYNYAVDFFNEETDSAEIEACYNSHISLLENRNDPKIRERLAYVYHSLGTYLLSKDNVKEILVLDTFNHALEIIESLNQKDTNEWIVLRSQMHMALVITSLKMVEINETDITELNSQTVYGYLESAYCHSIEVRKLIEGVKNLTIIEKIKESINVECFITIGLELGQFEEYDKGVEMLRLAQLLTSTDNIDQLKLIHTSLGLIYGDKGEYEKAEWHFKENLRLLEKTESVPGDEIAECLMKVSVMLARQEKFDECIEETKRALSLTSDDNNGLLNLIHSNLAFFYKVKGEYGNAAEHTRALITIMKKQGGDVSNHDIADTYNNLAEFLILLDRKDDALEALERALELVGEDEDEAQLTAAIHDHLAQIYQDRNEYEKAEHHYKENVRMLEKAEGVLGDEIAEHLINVGMMLVRQEKYDECIEVTKRALLLTSDDNNGLLRFIHSNLAFLYKEKGEYGNAAEHTRALIDIMEKQGEDVSNHDLADTYDDLGVFLILLDRKDDALEALERALELVGEDEAQLTAAIHDHLAQIYRDRNEFEKAEHHYKENVRMLEKVKGVSGDEIAERLMNVGVMLVQHGKYDECIEVTKRALSLTTDDNNGLLRSIHSNLAYLYKEKREYDVAEAHYRDLIGIMENSGEDVSIHDLADAYDDLGVNLYLQDKNDEAVEAIEHALTILEDNDNDAQLTAAIHNHLAQVYRVNKEYEKAEYHYKENLKQLEKIDGVSGDIIADQLMMVGVMLAHQEKYDECLDVIKRALLLTSDDNKGMLCSIHSNLAFLYMEKGEHGNAEDHYRALLDIMEKQGEDVSNHDLADAYDSLGVCLYAQNRCKEAVEKMEYALTILGDDGSEAQLAAAIHDHLAQVYQDLNENDKVEYHQKEKVRILGDSKKKNNA